MCGKLHLKVTNTKNDVIIIDVVKLTFGCLFVSGEALRKCPFPHLNSSYVFIVVEISQEYFKNYRLFPDDLYKIGKQF